MNREFVFFGGHQLVVESYQVTFTQNRFSAVVQQITYMQLPLRKGKEKREKLYCFPNNILTEVS